MPTWLRKYLKLIIGSRVRGWNCHETNSESGQRSSKKLESLTGFRIRPYQGFTNYSAKNHKRKKYTRKSEKLIRYFQKHFRYKKLRQICSAAKWILCGVCKKAVLKFYHKNLAIKYFSAAQRTSETF